jgi:copper transporter 1
MLFTWDTTNLCIVFERWHIRSTSGLIFSLIAVVALGAGYEALRESIRRYEHYLNKKNEAVPRKSAFFSLFPHISARPFHTEHA